MAVFHWTEEFPYALVSNTKVVGVLLKLIKKQNDMQDIEFVKELLNSDYRSHLPDEYPYPDLEQLISRTNFDFPTGTVAGARDNGAYNRDEIGYQYFPDSNKRILVHRFIVAVALGKWPPRDLDVHHINDKPDDNRPTNLELVTRRDNNSVRRAPLKKVADLTKANKWVSEIPKVEKQARNKGQRKKEPKPTADTPIEEFARVRDNQGGMADQSWHGETFQSVLPLTYSPMPDGRRVPPIEETLRKYYSIPEGRSWTGRRKGKDDCYWEATTGIWYYRKPT
ncbi:HNH endonuclease signature motif containing protein [uncultured Ruegeria sp.]|uniref:HNH endonuclease signature motif containing protein n=1 Tax=uncultured Ruegeria sp. TaxID=259304 RepID=UPI00261BC518|nr:HNH endonuclease signature motif containing protein [uncultured Ruegeria sp.]